MLSPPPEPRQDGQRARPSALTAGEVFLFERADGAQAAALEALVRGTDEIDPDALAARMSCRSPIAPGATVWQDIRARRLAPPDAIAPRPPRTAGEAVAVLRRALEESVDRAIDGARRVAVLTGGGVDSSALLALAVDRARRRGATAFAVSLDFGGEGDDRPYLRAVEEHLGCEVLRVRPEDGARSSRLVWGGVDAAPLAWPGGAMEIEALSRARAEGADRVLSGAGADALFDGNPRALARLVRRGRLREALDAARAMRGFTPPRRSRAWEWLVRPLVAEAVPASLRRARARRRFAAPPWAGPRLARFVAADQRRYADHSFSSRDDAGARARAMTSAPEIEAFDWYRHQQEVAARVARRDPYLDPTLAAVVASFEPEWLVHGAIRRGLFREAIRGLVPEVVRTRESKASFEEAFMRSVEGAGGFARFRDLARVTALADLGLVVPRPFHDAFEELATKPLESWGWGDVWPALATEAFLRSRARDA